MRYRILSDTRDYVFGAGSSEFLVNSPEAVGQAVLTRLLLMQGEWFLDTSEGTPYSTQILGTGTQALYDQAIQQRILGTPDVLRIDSYASVLDDQRNLTVSCTITTQFGQTQIQTVL